MVHRKDYSPGVPDLIVLTVFLATVALDIVWTYSINAIAKLEVARAGISTAALTALQVYIISSYVENTDAKVATVIGGACGAMTGVALQKYKIKILSGLQRLREMLRFSRWIN